MKVRVFLGVLFAVSLSGTDALAQTWQEALAALGETPAEYGAAQRWRRSVAAARAAAFFFFRPWPMRSTMQQATRALAQAMMMFILFRC